MISATALARWYLDEALRITELGAISQVERDALKDLDIAQSRSTATLTNRDLQQYGPRPLRRDESHLQKAMAHLVAKGYADAVTRRGNTPTKWRILVLKSTERLMGCRCGSTWICHYCHRQSTACACVLAVALSCLGPKNTSKIAVGWVSRFHGLQRTLSLL